MSINFQKLNNAYVLDNGNGNLMAYRINLQTRVVEPIVDKFGEPAGYAMTPKGDMMLGKALVGTDFTTYCNCSTIHMNFKAMPTEENREVMVKYLSGWLKKMKSNCSSIETDGDHAVWLIGCPTGWKSKKIREAYRKIFEDAGYVNPIIVWESNAALAHFQAANPRYAMLVKDGIVLCVDLGAYSNDATLIINGEIKSVGGFVGASIVEKMLVAVNIREQEKYRKSKGMLNPPELNVAVGQRFEMDPVFRNFMLLQGRWLKEQYFNRRREGTLTAKGLTVQVGLDGYPEFDGEEYLNLYTNTEMMNDILYNRPIRNVLGEKMFGELNKEVREEIGNFTWIQCLENFLRRVAMELPEFGDYATEQKTGKKPVVILTGGASQMDFVPVSVENVYSNIHLETDLTPVLSIALGLADFAPAKIDAMAVEQALVSIIKETHIDEDGDEVSTLRSVIDKGYVKFVFDTIGRVKAQETNQMVEAVTNWANNQYRSEEIVSRAKAGFRNQFDQKIIPEMRNDGKAAEKLMIDHINQRFTKNLQGSAVGDKQLFQNDEWKMPFVEAVIEELMPGVCDLVMEQYDLFTPIFSEFPNPGALNIFAESRMKFLQRNAGDLDEAIGVIATQTAEVMVSWFTDDRMIEIFVDQSLKKIILALLEKQGAILGELIVEESDEEESSEAE